MENQKFCQSCGMPMSEPAHFGTNADGSKNEEYCCYCFENGKFTDENLTLEQAIDTSVKYMVKEGMGEEESRKMCQELMPQLKRWAK